MRTNHLNIVTGSHDTSICCAIPARDYGRLYVQSRVKISGISKLAKLCDPEGSPIYSVTGTSGVTPPVETTTEEVAEYAKYCVVSQITE